MSELIRSFIAVVVAPEAARELRAAQDRLKEADGGVKWVNADGFHLTLKFLGEVERERLEAVWEAARLAMAGCAAFEMRFRGVGAFPDANRARVIWADVAQGAQELAELAQRAEEACAAHGFPRENRPFRAHLTLGRVRQPGPNPGLAGVIRELAETELGRSPVDRVVLMKSELTRQGAIYHELKHAALTGEGETDERET